jgi:hypothetical protein
MSELGVVFYQGPSLLTGDPIIGVLTGLDHGSMNAKTGAIAQAWILRSDLPPMEAKRQNLDDAVCGDCKLRGRNGKNSGCYVPVWVAPYTVYKSFLAGHYPTVTWAELHAVVEGRMIRLGAYGDPAAISYEIWRVMLASASSWIGYTHSWKRCDPRFKTIVMASVDSEDEFIRAGLAGWRTFRVRLPDEPLIAGAEFICPASDEAGHRTTCARCQLCRGTSSPARSVAIIAHGKPSSLRAFGIRVPMFGRSPQLGSKLNAHQIHTEPPLLRAKFYRNRAEARV